MAQRKLHTVLATFTRTVIECRQLAVDAHRWSAPTRRGGGFHLSPKRCDAITELAFLRAFLAWETFLEQSFVLYLAGQKPPRGLAPKRYAFPPDHQTAISWVIPEGRRYARWTVPGEVWARAERFFQGGRPFVRVLRGNQQVLDEAHLIRNAIAHESPSARQTFENVVRNKLGTLPVNVTVGGFLGSTIPGIAPPASFLEFYLGKIESAALQIVPS